MNKMQFSTAAGGRGWSASRSPGAVPAMLKLFPTALGVPQSAALGRQCDFKCGRGRSVFAKPRLHWHGQVTLLSCLLLFVFTQATTAQDIETRFLHLRNKPDREWSDFPETAEHSRLTLAFASIPNEGECALMLRQQDVKQQWFVSLNGKRLGELVRDENDMTIGLAIPANLLKDADNSLVIEAPDAKAVPDDIRVGHIALVRRPLKDVLSDARVEVTVVAGRTNESLPCRISILDTNGSLVSLGTTSNDELAIRPGTAYTSTGKATLKLPAGKYTICAGRGFEYSLAQAEFTVRPGETHQQALSIRREVPTEGYVACDTHVHTLTHSGHGDATINERMITLAGEGIELPIATDHNVHVDYEPIAQKLGVRKYFTPVMGNEVTTARGHFNIFPVAVEARVPDHKQTEWGLLLDDIFRTPGVRVAILNHARDLHSGVRPFGPALHDGLAGENLENWPLRFNAMEVVNSGATQTSPLQLFEDWMTLLNRGLQITPVGSSDSHDVARHFVGQGRTYIRCDDRDPGNLDVGAAVNNFLQGRVMVSYGLAAELWVDDKYTSGDFVTSVDQQVRIRVRVLGPDWVRADRVLLFANGALLRDEEVPRHVEESLPLGVKCISSFTIPRPRHDVHLVAIAVGPGVEGNYWRTAKAYQPTSQDPTTKVIGCSGAVWLDADADGRRSTARDYAERLIATSAGESKMLISRLADYDQATHFQAAYLLRAGGVLPGNEAMQAALKDATKEVKTDFQRYQAAWRENEVARRKP